MVDWSSVQVEFGPGPTVITLLELARRMKGVTGCNSSEDEMLTFYLQSAGDLAEKYTENSLARQSVTEQKAVSAYPVHMAYWPYFDGLTVEVGGEDVTEDYTVHRDGLRAYAAKGPCEQSANVCFEQMTLTYNAGYDPLPPDLGTVIVQTALQYEQILGGTGVVRRETVAGVGTIEYYVPEDQSLVFGDMSVGTITVLNRYRAIRV